MRFLCKDLQMLIKQNKNKKKESEQANKREQTKIEITHVVLYNF